MANVKEVTWSYLILFHWIHKEILTWTNQFWFRLRSQDQPPTCWVLVWQVVASPSTVVATIPCRMARSAVVNRFVNKYKNIISYNFTYQTLTPHIIHSSTGWFRQRHNWWIQKWARKDHICHQWLAWWGHLICECWWPILYCHHHLHWWSDYFIKNTKNNCI